MALISICVCTFRRPEGLRRTLASLAVLQLLPGSELEVVVVDNDEVGSAVQKVDAMRASFPFPLRCVVERRSGVGHARNRCCAEAQGEWVAFIDDDEIAEPQWLVELWQQREASDADGVFGPVLAVLPPQASPAWLIESGYYARPRMASGALLDWQHCASGNVLFRRQLFARVGGFNAAFAATGAEDSDFFWRCLSLQARFVWCDTAIAHETIPPERMTMKWILRRSFLGGHNYVRLRARRFGRQTYAGDALIGALALFVYGALSLAARMLGDRRSVPCRCKAAVGLGKLMAAFPVKTVYGDMGSRKQAKSHVP